MATGLLFNLQRFSVHDGPGIRTTVFLKGCPAQCAWCHNPESRSPLPQVVRQEGRCIQCGSCIEVCPWHMQGADESGTAARCSACGACVEACPVGARELLGREWTVAELMAELLRDRVFYETSGGGVTFSGGEPLTQAPFVLSALAECREAGLHTALDTCGYGDLETLFRVAARSDLVLFDLKHTDPERHLAATGLPLAPILANLRALADVHRNLWIRVPVIPGINDDDANLARTAALVRNLPGVRKVSLLPYHRAAQEKFRRLGERWRLPDIVPPTAARMEEIRGRFAAAGLPAAIGG